MSLYAWREDIVQVRPTVHSDTSPRCHGVDEIGMSTSEVENNVGWGNPAPEVILYECRPENPTTDLMEDGLRSTRHQSCTGPAPTEGESYKHPQSNPKRTCIADIPAFAHAGAGVKRDRALDHECAPTERDIHEVGVEFEVHARVQ